ncbi:hypothetical protein BDV96DRAFT_355436 [Lophiotrema nucula]|uniref:Uncharacterized protein n=1 Tax=Lophiotrema nucula TaxID=690887 RepID=A0A6A5YFU2_9PLEO|nr:hypothetical protein BDV96DRAFT_355436 [Lophiotrema nucula]
MSPYDGDDSGFENEQMDTIDLTNSSPEPSPRRYAVPHRSRATPAAQQTRLTDYVKVENQSNGPTRTAHAQGGANRIDHVYHIIRTTDPQAIQTVLFNLCKVSPALCGAVARGLAPHSTYAQSVIRGARQQPTSAPVDRPTGVKVEQRARPAYREPPMKSRFERKATQVKQEPLLNVKRESGGPPTTSVPSGSSTPRVPADKFYNVDYSSSEELLELPSLPKSVKKERAPSPARSDKSSSAAFSDVTPTIRRRTTATSLPLRPPSATPLQSTVDVRNEFTSARSTPNSLAKATALADPKLSEQSLLERPSSSSDEEPGTRLLVCNNCNQAIDESTSKICYYHPGHRRRTLPGAGPGSLRYDCCQQGVLSRGCELGRHATDSTSQTRPRAPSSFSPTLHRPTKAPRLR